MIETWRWFGPDDPVPLSHVPQTGTVGVVTALHHRNRGGAWPLEEVLARRAEVEAAGLAWPVVESIAVSESIKTRTGDFRARIADYQASIRAVGAAGVRTVCYNFMAVTDWTRTDLMWPLPTGGFALRFDAVAFAAYDLFVLRRPGAEGDYAAPRIADARARFEAFTPGDIARLESNLIEWLPAREEGHDRASFRRMLDIYADLTTEGLRENLIAFLREITPVAEEAGVRLAIHPDDPAFPLFGLPRAMSTAADARALLDAVPQPTCGLTFCTGSFGSRTENDIPAMAREFASRIHFAHLRNVSHEVDGSFHEAAHLGGDVDMVEVAAILLAEEARRADEGRGDAQIPFRPDHGHLLMSDIGQPVNPGYSGIGRMKGLAELRGVIRALQHGVRGGGGVGTEGVAR